TPPALRATSPLRGEEMIQAERITRPGMGPYDVQRSPSLSRSLAGAEMLRALEAANSALQTAHLSDFFSAHPNGAGRHRDDCAVGLTEGSWAAESLSPMTPPPPSTSLRAGARRAPPHAKRGEAGLCRLGHGARLRAPDFGGVLGDGAV